MNVHSSTLPFGRHRGQPIDEVPSDYLRWAAQNCKLSHPLWLAVAAELVRRGLPAPTPPPRDPLPPCPRCGSADEPLLSWHQQRDGRRAIRRTCGRCGAWRGTAPQTSGNIAAADRAAIPTAALDALLLSEEEGVELVSDGRGILLGRNGHRASARLRDAVRQQGHLLASLLGRRTAG